MLALVSFFSGFDENLIRVLKVQKLRAYFFLHQTFDCTYIFVGHFSSPKVVVLSSIFEIKLFTIITYAINIIFLNEKHLYHDSKK